MFHLNGWFVSLSTERAARSTSGLGFAIRTQAGRVVGRAGLKYLGN